MNSIVQKIFNGVVDGDTPGVQESVNEAIQTGLEAAAILNEGLIPAMAEVGRRFEEGEYFVPEMLISARAMKTGMAILQPLLVQNNIKAAGTVVIGTVKGDLHDIGKNLVSLMLEGAGFKVIDAGADIPAERFVEIVNTNQVDIVAMSALLTTTMTNMKATIEALETAGLRKKVKVMIGGAPVTESYAQQIGADGYAADASRAVAVARQLVSA
ncbi:MAG TPA: corrinoid protein [Longilinea sp.]|nr:corrinoid protein [Longilinea sp.]